jgi:hypothetical protein
MTVVSHLHQIAIRDTHLHLGDHQPQNQLQHQDDLHLRFILTEYDKFHLTNAPRDLQ